MKKILITIMSMQFLCGFATNETFPVEYRLQDTMIQEIKKRIISSDTSVREIDSVLHIVSFQVTHKTAVSVRDIALVKNPQDVTYQVINKIFYKEEREFTTKEHNSGNTWWSFFGLKTVRRTFSLKTSGSNVLVLDEVITISPDYGMVVFFFIFFSLTIGAVLWAYFKKDDLGVASNRLVGILIPLLILFACADFDPRVLIIPGSIFIVLTLFVKISRYFEDLDISDV